MSVGQCKSLENYIFASCVFVLGIILILVALLMILLGFSTLVNIFSLSFVSLVFFALSGRLYHRVMIAFDRASLHLEAIETEDFNVFSKPYFSRGRVHVFHQQLKRISGQLQRRKFQHDQQIYIVYQLIAQLDTPILVLNQNHQLTYGNDAFQQLFSKPWQMLRHVSAQALGLDCNNKQWTLSENILGRSSHQLWEIRQSEFIDGGEAHQLLVFINIESVLRKSQLAAWQQIIRVLGHEIRNSLAPVSSLAESLAENAVSPREKQALGVITERCQHLHSFVDRYSSLSQDFHLSRQWISVTVIVDRISCLFTAVELKVDNTIDSLWVDGPVFEQVLINLIKNCVEAAADCIAINFSSLDKDHLISIVDNGHGFKNRENLFVPLYTTKPQGQGIGLVFCRNIIEQHGGSIDLCNNEDRGVCVSIKIPNNKDILPNKKME